MGNVGYGGGLKINTFCETNLNGLFAAGDATCGPASGVEGFCAYAIPFATTSGAISGIAASEYIKGTEDISPSPQEVRAFAQELSRPLNTVDGVEPDYLMLKVQELLFPMDIYLIRHHQRLQQALAKLCELRDEFVPFLKAYDPHYLRMAIEASNMVTCGELFLRAAITRTESRGSHFREDHSAIDNINWLKWIILKEDNGNIRVSTEEIPIETYPLKPERKKYTHPIAKVMKGLK
jgi:succinate dehydrogenase/fumarate reductase flavoprotein subunit